MFKNISENSAASNGTHLQDYIDIVYKHLVEVFGQPGKGDGYKVDALWILQFENGRIVTIYNYKDGKNYNGDAGKPVWRIRNWHIGGTVGDEFALVQSAIEAVFGPQ